MPERTWKHGDENCLMESTDPVHVHSDSTWWFYDETWGSEYGPYDSKVAAEAGCSQYATHVLGV